MPAAQQLTVGDAVLYPREHAVGLIYEVYERGPGERPGVQLLLSRGGRDLSGFSAEEADQFLVPLGHTGLRYEFTHVGQLHADYRRGHFAAFATARLLAGFQDPRYLAVP
ncbi:hypothetical protein LJ737_23275 [Hymenobacter sp. 15J16-1T3B]|uniref:hypothetical protein n=1 Tax=unclassified Hymenobacter TaxID=2615202 RepID=UPI001D100651|nr:MULTISPECIES: hypothetical protein [unclassified Hymenobacter]MCC3160177.1 hypothetical protein [Hymenobacter sp. 15J16-1T3B]UYZ61300.1 hypothetical protein OIS50_20215 [Hymenobacter sp. YIM 151858-1]